MITWLISLALVVFFLFLVALFAGAETGFVCLDISILKNRAQTENGKPERSLLKIAKQPERFLALTLIGINMAIVIGPTPPGTGVMNPATSFASS